MTQLTGRSKEVFEYIIFHKENNDGNSPTIREIINYTSITSTSVVQYYLDKLEDLSLIRPSEKQRWRGIMVTGGKWTYQEEDN